MDLINTHKGTIRLIEGNIVTIAHRRGGTSKAVVNRKFTVGQVVCFTVDPVYLNITNVMLKSEADNIIKKSGSEELQIAASTEEMPLSELNAPEFTNIDPVEQFFGREEEDYDYDDFFNSGQVSQKQIDTDNGEDRGDVRNEADYFEE